jgi:hypothetical protein
MNISTKSEDFKTRIDVAVQPHLYWYDRPILFPMKTDRGLELCILVDETEPENGKDYGNDIFASVVVSEDELQDVIHSRTDLRSAFEGVQKPRLFVWVGHGEGAVFVQELSEPLPEKYLSEEDAYLDYNVSETKSQEKPS